MVPRANQEALPVAQRLWSGCSHAGEVVDRPLEEDVVPATDIERGDVQRVVARRDIEVRPEIIVRRMAGPVIVVRRELAEDLVPGQRQAGEFLRQVVCAREQRLKRRICGRVFLPLARHGIEGERAHRPGEIEAELERAALIRPSSMVIGSSDRRGDHFQGRVAADRRLPLRQPDVRAAEHADIAVAPRLRDEPFQRVVAVLPLIDEGIEPTLGLEPPAHILHDDRVAAPRRPQGEADIGADVLLIVRRPLQERRIRPRPGRAVDIREEYDAVAHRRWYIAIHTERQSFRHRANPLYALSTPIPRILARRAKLLNREGREGREGGRRKEEISVSPLPLFAPSRFNSRFPSVKR